MRTSEHALPPSGLVVLLGGLVYTGTLAGLVAIGAPDRMAAFHAVLQTTESIVWCSLIAAQATLWVLAVVPLWRRIRAYGDEAVRSRLDLAAALTGILVLLALFMASHQMIPDTLTFPVAHQKAKVRLLTLAGAMVFVFALSGMHLVGIAARHLERQVRSGRGGVVELLKMRADLQLFLAAAGFIIGAATLSTGAANQALAALNPGGFVLKPGNILIYGAFGSGVIALVYFPAHLTVRSAAAALADRLLPLPAYAPGKLAAWHDGRTRLETVLGLHAPVAEGFKTALAVLTPLAGSAVSLLLGVKG